MNSLIKLVLKPARYILSSIAPFSMRLLSKYPYLTQVTQFEITLMVFWIYVERVEGDIIEFGTFSGTSAKTISRAMSEGFKYTSTTRDLYLVDTFEGLPEITSEVDRLNEHVIAGRWSVGSMKEVSENQLRKICADELGSAGRCFTFKGLFKDFRLAADKKVALINFDGDLYESALQALRPLFERQLVSTGALILFDDYFCSKGDPNVGEMLAWTQLVNDFQIQYIPYKLYGLHGASFIVRSYRSNQEHA